jgi:hypothetical protein
MHAAPHDLPRLHLSLFAPKVPLAAAPFSAAVFSAVVAIPS